MITISDATETSRFSDIVLRNSVNIYSVTWSGGYLGDNEVKTITLNGRGIMAVLPSLKAVCVRAKNLVNGMPYEAIKQTSGIHETQAVTTTGGELVKLTAAHYDEVSRNETGILVADFQTQRVLVAQTLTLTFMPCQFLKIYAASSSVLWLPSPPS
jgi:hypothetical protein